MEKQQSSITVSPSIGEILKMRIIPFLTDGLVKLLGVFLLVFSIASILQAIYSLPVSAKQGQFGFDWDHGTRTIIFLMKNRPAEKAGLKKGDQIILIDGKPIEKMDLDTIFFNPVAGSKMTLTVKRGNHLLDIPMTRQLLPLVDRVKSLSLLLSFPLLLMAYTLVGLWCVIKQSSAITKLIAMVCFLFGAMLYNMATAPVSSWLSDLGFYKISGIIMGVSSALGPSFWLYLLNRFPQKSTFLKKHNSLTLLYIFSVPALLIVFNTYIIPVYFRTNSAADITTWVNFIYMFIYILMGLITFLRGGRKEQNILKKRQYQLTRFGIKYGSLSIFLGLITYNLYSYLEYYMSYPLKSFLGWTMLIFFCVTQTIGLILPFTFFNSFLKNKILETESALRRKIRYIASAFCLFLLYLSISFLLSNWIVSNFKLTDTSLIILIVLIFSLTFSPLHNRIMRWLEEKLYPEKTKYKISLKELTRQMGGFIEESQVLENVRRWISETMGIYPIYVVSLKGAGDMNIPLPSGNPPPIEAAETLESGSYFLWDERLDQLPSLQPEVLNDEDSDWGFKDEISITVPMIFRDEPMGFLNIGKKKNNEDFTGDDLEIFREAAYYTAMALQNIKLQGEHLEKIRIDKEMDLAREIQTRLMPHHIPKIEGLLVHSEYKPCFEVSGDYFDIIPIDKYRTALVIADVSGKGTGAALLMANLQAGLRMAISISPSLPLAELVSKTNRMIFENSLPTQFITFFIGVWNSRTKTFQYINAGHNPPLLLKKNNKISQLYRTGISLGIKANSAFTCKEISLDIDDLLFIYTDGIEEFFNYRNEEFGIHRMIDVFQTSRDLLPEQIIQNLMERIKEFAEGEKSFQCDDLTILIAKRIE